MTNCALWTIEAGDVIAKLILASEFELQQLTISEKLPQQTFGGCLLLARSRASSTGPVT